MDRTNKNASDRWANGMGHYSRQEIKRDVENTNRGMPHGAPRHRGAPDQDSLNKGKGTRRAGKGR